MLNALVLIALLSSRHPIHSSSAVVSVPAGAARAAIVLRVFADDFPPGVSRGPIERYLADRFHLLDARGAVIPLRLDGVATEGVVLVLTMSAPAADGLSGGRVWHGVLAEKFSDQVNLVRVQRGDRSTSLLFISGDGPKPLP